MLVVGRGRAECREFYTLRKIFEKKLRLMVLGTSRCWA